MAETPHPVPIDADLLQQLVEVLSEGESVNAFVEDAIWRAVDSGRATANFLARGEAA